MKQTMLIVGLGLIGGSLALALKGFEDFEIVGATPPSTVWATV